MLSASTDSARGGWTDNGRKNFERHFQEANHTFGMKALGLPNTKHFHEITKIEDAIACEPDS